MSMSDMHHPSPEPTAGRRRVAILGGGVGAITAAWALSEPSPTREPLDITVYQLGWRLGGKGASGRNAAHGQRIEEHGLHVWLGWYHNAFAVLHRCYDELGRSPTAPLARLEQAFAPHDHVGVAHRATSHGRTFWMLDFPRTERRIGADEPSRLRDHLGILVRLVARHLRQSLLQPLHPDEPRVHGLRDRLRPTLLLAAGRRLRRKVTAELLARLDALASSRDPAATARALAPVLERVRARLASVVVRGSDAEDELDGLSMLLDFATATLRGLVRDRALLFGLDVLDAWDLREWLHRHGARPSTVHAPFIKAWYDLAFAYEHGDTNRPNFAAGAALRAILRTALTYHGAIFWKMQAGMGDVVFAPLYEVLRRRGVRFEFFHRVDEVEVEAIEPPPPAGAGQRVARVHITVQATPKTGEYDPLVDVGGLPCWPSAPRLEQLVEGEALAREGIDLECPWSPWPGVGQRVLERGRDFDELVFGISLGAVPTLCPRLVATNPAWASMVERVATVATQAVQLWMEPPLAELGWCHGSPILDAYDDPFNTWADMTFLLGREAWRGPKRPRSLAYLVGPLHEHAPPPPLGAAAGEGFQARAVEAVRERARRWLDRAAPGIWPATARGGAHPGFDASVLHDAAARAPHERLDAQYIRANVAGSERYVQSLRGTTRHRLFVERCGVDGLYPVGDWLNTGINSGDVEAATITGLQAARAILGDARRITGEGDGWGRYEVDRRVAVAGGG
jgi:uncharacterized protein with NAD-binding domain and iron-sulfur cluster